MNAKGLQKYNERLARATKRLAAVLAEPKNEFIRDAAIQRFEFTFELSWKALKAHLAHEGIEVRTPRQAIREAFSAGYIPNDPAWLEMIELRNLTSHTYDEQLAEQVYRELPRMLKLFEGLVERLTTGE